MKIFYNIIANIIFLVHTLIFIIVFFGGFFPQYKNLYLFTLIITFASDMLFGYCLVSEWEYYFRKKVNPKLDYDFTWTTHYLHKITNKHISPIFYKYLSFWFLLVSILINLYFRFAFQ